MVLQQRRIWQSCHPSRSFNTALQGVRVNLHADDWQHLVELELLESGQVGLETSVLLAELALSRGICFELTA